MLRAIPLQAGRATAHGAGGAATATASGDAVSASRWADAAATAVVARNVRGRHSWADVPRRSSRALRECDWKRKRPLDPVTVWEPTPVSSLYTNTVGRLRVLVVGVVASSLVLGSVACSGGTDPSVDASPTPPEREVQGQAVPEDVTRCPITLPNNSVPPGQRLRDFNYGNGKLWTLLWPYGAVVASRGFVQPDGSINMKFPWFRAVEGELTIEGLRLNGASAAPQAEVPDDYGLTGFQPSSIIFPTEGCWELTGKVKDARLTFVVLVVKASTYALE